MRKYYKINLSKDKGWTLCKHRAC